MEVGLASGTGTKLGMGRTARRLGGGAGGGAGGVGCGNSEGIADFGNVKWFPQLHLYKVFIKRNKRDITTHIHGNKGGQGNYHLWQSSRGGDYHSENSLPTA